MSNGRPVPTLTVRKKLTDEAVTYCEEDLRMNQIAPAEGPRVDCVNITRIGAERCRFASNDFRRCERFRDVHRIFDLCLATCQQG